MICNRGHRLYLKCKNVKCNLANRAGKEPKFSCWLYFIHGTHPHSSSHAELIHKHNEPVHPKFAVSLAIVDAF